VELTLFGRRIAARSSEDDAAFVATSACLFLYVDLAALDLTWRFSRRQASQDVLDLGLDRIRPRKL